MITAREIVKGIGRDLLQEELNVGYKALIRAELDNRFPARWAEVIKTECSKRRMDCPDALFNFIRPSQEPHEAAE